MSQQEFFVSKPWKFACETCQKETVKKGRNFLILPFCKPCVSATARIASQKGREKPRTKEEYLSEREIQHQERQEFFGSYGFELLSPSSDYQGVYSELSALCPNKHTIKIKWNNFLGDVTKGKGCCSQCLFEKRKKPWEEIVAKFREKNCEILLEEKDYCGNKQDILFRCFCGRESTVRLGNINESWMGCLDCSKQRERVPWENVKEIFREANCELLSEEREYKHNKSRLLAICSCEFEGNTFEVCLKHLKKGKRCAKCTLQRRENTCMQIYGVRNPSQNDEIISKIKRKSYMTKEFVLPNSKKVWFLQGYEPFCIRDLVLVEGFDEEEILTGKGVPKIFYENEGKTRKFYPDIFIPHLNKIIEVKSEWTMWKDKQKNMDKMKATKEAGFDIEFRIYSSKGKLLETLEAE
ncbi:hypothetical protein B1750_gp114 [Noumeavirus]|uniref:hypothetical protein n=1 Tax=Noumeavirus TaxID=1955558 RepID=UPI000982EF81|nr:hypothetical protein B1750_gp114 [Noumeavirus]AQM73095.1 hypothetical protein NMV_114 [Noumeavirus]